MGFICLIQIIYKYLHGHCMFSESILVTERLVSIISYFLPDLGWFTENPFPLRFCVIFSHFTRFWRGITKHNSNHEFQFKNLYLFPTDCGMKSKCLALKPFYDLTPVYLQPDLTLCVPHSAQPKGLLIIQGMDLLTQIEYPYSHLCSLKPDPAFKIWL